MPDGAPVHYERHRPEQTTLYRQVQQYAAIFIEQAEAEAGAALPQYVKDEFDSLLECGILSHGLMRLRCGDCGDCGHDKLVAFSCKRRGFCPSCGARCMAQTAAHLENVSARFSDLGTRWHALTAGSEQCVHAISRRTVVIPVWDISTGCGAFASRQRSARCCSIN